MKTSKRILALFCLFAMTAFTQVNSAEVKSSTPMTDKQVDAVFDWIFAMQKKLKNVQANLLTTKKGGGLFTKDIKTMSEVTAQLPNRLLKVDKGTTSKKLPENQYSYVLIDGLYLWEMNPVAGKPGAYETEFRDMKRAGKVDIDLVKLLVGASVNSGRELRDLFTITGAVETYKDNTKSYYFHLKTIPGKEVKKRKEDVEIWVRDGEIIPWKVHNITLEPVAKANAIFGGNNSSSKTKYKKKESIQELSNIQTNLSNPPLLKIPYTTFWFGTLLQKYPNNRIVNEKGDAIDKMTQQRTLTNILTVLQKP